MKKITQQDLNKKVAVGASVKQLRPPKPTENEILAAIAEIRTRQNDDFRALADVIDGQSREITQCHSEIRTLQTVKGKRAIQLRVNRGTNRLVKDIDIAEISGDGGVRVVAKATFNRVSGTSDLDTIDIVPRDRSM